MLFAWKKKNAISVVRTRIFHLIEFPFNVFRLRNRISFFHSFYHLHRNRIWFRNCTIIALNEMIHHSSFSSKSRPNLINNFNRLHCIKLQIMAHSIKRILCVKRENIIYDSDGLTGDWVTVGIRQLHIFSCNVASVVCY